MLTQRKSQLFSLKVDKNGPMPAAYCNLTTPCWLWSGSKNSHGYGNFRLTKTRTERAHRIAYAASVGLQDTPKKQVLHKCDTPACVNPAHLFIGTHADNMKDRESKNRGNYKAAKGDSHYTRRNPSLVRKGENHSCCLITDDQILSAFQLRLSGAKIRDIADHLGVARESIGTILRGDRRTENVPASLIEAVKKLPRSHNTFAMALEQALRGALRAG